MTLSQIQRATVQSWLDQHWLGQAKCPAGHDDWSVAPSLSFMPGFATTPNGPKIVHEDGFTFVVLTCGDCGYVALLDTKKIALSLSG
jgi:hypothetical protein